MSEPLDELGALRRWLGDLRGTVARKADGLSPEQLAARSVPPSDLSILGLVRHLAQMEHHWFVRTLSRADEPQLYVPAGDWDAQFRDAVADEAVVADAFDTWRGVLILNVQCIENQSGAGTDQQDTRARLNDFCAIRRAAKFGDQRTG